MFCFSGIVRGLIQVCTYRCGDRRALGDENSGKHDVASMESLNQLRNKDKLNEYNRKYKELHKDDTKEYMKTYLKSYRERKKERLAEIKQTDEQITV